MKTFLGLKPLPNPQNISEKNHFDKEFKSYCDALLALPLTSSDEIIFALRHFSEFNQLFHHSFGLIHHESNQNMNERTKQKYRLFLSNIVQPYNEFKKSFITHINSKIDERIKKNFLKKYPEWEYFFFVPFIRSKSKTEEASEADAKSLIASTFVNGQKLDSFCESLQSELNAKKRASMFSALISSSNALHSDLKAYYETLVRERIQKGSNFKKMRFQELRRPYTPTFSKQARALIKQYILPLYDEFLSLKADIMGIDKISPADYRVPLNYIPVFSVAEAVKKNQLVANEIHPEFGKFYSGMITKGILDLEIETTKSAKKYFYPLGEYGIIFGSYPAGTSGFVSFLNHESGHAYQSSLQFANPLPLRGQMIEVAESTAHSTELFALDKINLIYKGDALRAFRFQYWETFFDRLLWAARIDAFEHYAYAGGQDLSGFWLEESKKFHPSNMTWNEAYENNRCFFQGHIYDRPFYYIAYLFARIVALNNAQLYRKKASIFWKTFTQRLAKGNTVSPKFALDDIGLTPQKFPVLVRSGAEFLKKELKTL